MLFCFFFPASKCFKTKIIALGPGLPWIEELVFCLNSEESLPEGPVRFGVFITELVK